MLKGKRKWCHSCYEPRTSLRPSQRHLRILPRARRNNNRLAHQICLRPTDWQDNQYEKPAQSMVMHARVNSSYAALLAGHNISQRVLFQTAQAYRVSHHVPTSTPGMEPNVFLYNTGQHGLSL